MLDQKRKQLLNSLSQFKKNINTSNKELNILQKTFYGVLHNAPKDLKGKIENFLHRFTKIKIKAQARPLKKTNTQNKKKATVSRGKSFPKKAKTTKVTTI